MSEEQLREKINDFENNREYNPIFKEVGGIIVLNLYKLKREGTIYQEGIKNTKDIVEERKDYFTKVILDKGDLSDIEQYISFENFTITKNLNEFSELQNIRKSILSFTSNIPDGFQVIEVQIIDKNKYNNYLEHLQKVKLIRQKTNKIIKDKFTIYSNQNNDVDTSAIFSNVGYIVKGFEGRYINLSRGDKTFIKNFMDGQIRDGAYKLTIKETIPFYKESIKEIINIGKEILQLTGNKNSIKKFSKKYFDKEIKSLESCWQTFFDKYLRVMLMNYKEFHSQSIFKNMVNYDKNCKPDFLAVDIYNNVDVIEIKTHKTILFRKENNRDSYYPSHDLNKSIFQLNKYMDLKTENIEVNNIKNEYVKSMIENDKIYRPRGILIISSQQHIVSEQTNDEITARLEKEIKKLKTTYNNIDIILFDELITNLENYIEYIDIELTSNT